MLERVVFGWLGGGGGRSCGSDLGRVISGDCLGAAPQALVGRLRQAAADPARSERAGFRAVPYISEREGAPGAVCVGESVRLKPRR